jgi:NADH-quinone oxidoreductase subunit J
MTEPLAILAVAATDSSPIELLRKCITDPRTLATAAVAAGIWWLLPGSGATRRVLGALLAAIGFGIFASRIPVAGEWLAQSLMAVIAGATVVAAVATISCRSPVYCAIWFGMTLAGTAGLFLLAGAAFLAVATLVVYAGAILVTFLFVLMLSQPEGHTTYDRRSWEALVSAVTGALLVGVFTATISAALTDSAKLSSASENGTGREESRVASQSPDTRSSRVRHTARSQANTKATTGVSSSHADRLAEGEGQPKAASYDVAQLGAELFTRYLVAVEGAGALLFAALVGAAVIVAQGRAAMKGRNPLIRPGGTANAS